MVGQGGTSLPAEGRRAIGDRTVDEFPRESTCSEPSEHASLLPPCSVRQNHEALIKLCGLIADGQTIAVKHSKFRPVARFLERSCPSPDSLHLGSRYGRVVTARRRPRTREVRPRGAHEIRGAASVLRVSEILSYLGRRPWFTKLDRWAIVPRRTMARPQPDRGLGPAGCVLG
jgi:hypothetical protein